MTENLKADSITKAIRMLPKAKSYQPNTITIRIDKIMFIFEKHNNEWYFKV